MLLLGLILIYGGLCMPQYEFLLGVRVLWCVYSCQQSKNELDVNLHYRLCNVTFCQLRHVPRF